MVVLYNPIKFNRKLEPSAFPPTDPKLKKPVRKPDQEKETADTAFGRVTIWATI